MIHSDIIGALLAILASILSNIGVNVQKYSHANNELLPKTMQIPYIKQPIWWIGLILVIIGSFGDFIAFGFATQALVAPLGGGSTLVANVVNAYYINKEKLYRTDIYGVIWIIIAVVIISIVTDPDETLNFPDLEKRFFRKEFIIYISIVFLFTMSLMAKIKGSLVSNLKHQLLWSNYRQKNQLTKLESRFYKLENRVKNIEKTVIENRSENTLKNPLIEKIEKSNENNIVDNVNEEINKEEDILHRYESSSYIPYYYAICSGIIGSFSVLLAKCSAILIMFSIKTKKNQFESEPLSYLFFIGMIVTILIQTHLLNMATLLGNTITVFPIFQSCWICFSVLGGIIFYETMNHFTIFKWCSYLVALFSMFIGIFFLIQHGKYRLDNENINTKEKKIKKKLSLSDLDYYKYNKNNKILQEWTKAKFIEEPIELEVALLHSTMD